MKIITMTIAALALSTSFAAASTSSFERSLESAEQAANGETTLKECIKTAVFNVMIEGTGITRADWLAVPQYIKDQIEVHGENLAETTLQAVDAVNGDYIKAVEGIVLGSVKGGVFSAVEGKEVRDGLVACFDAAK